MDKHTVISALERAWANEARWNGITRPYNAGDVYRLRGSIDIEYSLARYGAARLWELLRDDDYVAVLSAITGNQAIQQVQAGLKAIYVSGATVGAPAGRRLRRRAVGHHREPGDPAGPGRVHGDLRERLAGGRGWQSRARDVPRPEPVPVRLRSRPAATHQQRPQAGRPDRAPQRRPLDLLVRPAGGRRRSGVRRAAARLRGHEKHDRRRSGGRALRRPARVGEEVRPSGRQGARAHE